MCGQNSAKNEKMKKINLICFSPLTFDTFNLIFLHFLIFFFRKTIAAQGKDVTRQREGCGPPLGNFLLMAVSAARQAYGKSICVAL